MGVDDLVYIAGKNSVQDQSTRQRADDDGQQKDGRGPLAHLGRQCRKRCGVGGRTGHQEYECRAGTKPDGD